MLDLRVAALTLKPVRDTLVRLSLYDFLLLSHETIMSCHSKNKMNIARDSFITIKKQNCVALMNATKKQITNE